MKTEGKKTTKSSKHAIRFLSHQLAFLLIRSSSDTMTSNNPSNKPVTPQFVCQVCGNFLEQDASLNTIDDQIMKPIGKISLRFPRSNPTKRLFQPQVQISVMSRTMNCSKAAYVLPIVVRRLFLFSFSLMELLSFEKRWAESDCKFH